jgi:hypothetical protein
MKRINDESEDDNSDQYKVHLDANLHRCIRENTECRVFELVESNTQSSVARTIFPILDSIARAKYND